MKRAAIYVRVSTQEQKMNGLSVDNQKDALVKYCQDNGYAVVDIYNDAGISARKSYTKRPELLRLMQDCKSNKVDVILFTRLDRWFRSVSDYYQVQTILDECKVPWRAIWEDYETETSSGIFKVNIMLSIAQAEADRTKEKIKSVKQYQKEKGEYVGSASIGYIKKDSQLYIDEEKKDGVKAIWDTYLKTYSQMEAYKVAQEYGLKIHLSAIGKILHNPVYYGLASGYYKCEPYITKEQFDQVQNHMKLAPRKAKDNRVYIFSGILKCSCGNRMGGTYVFEKKMNKNYYHYKCYAFRKKDVTHKCNTNIAEIKLEKYLLKNLDSIISDYNASTVVKAVDKANEQKLKERKILDQKLKRLAVLFEEGDIDIAEYRKKRDAIRQQLSLIVLEKEKNPVNLPTDWQEAYNTLTPPNKHKFWREILESIVISPDKSITINFK